MNDKRLSYEELVAYAAGELDPARSAEVAALLAGDVSARRVITRLEALLALARADDSTEPPQNVAEQARALFRERAQPTPAGTDWLTALRRIAAELVFDSRPRAALAGLRGATANYQLAFESELADVDLEVRSGEGTAPRVVQGQVSVRGELPVKALAFAPAGSLEPTAHSSPDKHGMFKTELEPGKYDVFVSIQDTVVVLSDVVIE